MLYCLFWVILRRLNFMCRRFEILCSIFIGGIRPWQSRPGYSSCLHHLWRWNTVFRNVDTKFRRRGITQTKEYNIQNMAKVWSRARYCHSHPYSVKRGEYFLWYYGKRYESFNIRVLLAHYLSLHYQNAPTFQCITNKGPTLPSQESNGTSNSSTWKYQSAKMLPNPRLVHSISGVNYWMWFGPWIEAVRTTLYTNLLGISSTEVKCHVVLISCHKTAHVLWERLMFQKTKTLFWSIRGQASIWYTY
jgi:hypothetical protein